MSLGPRIAVVAHKRVPAWPIGGREYQQVGLETALRTVWPTDAHLVTYLCPTDDGMQPRLRKIDAHEYKYQPICEVLMADVDNPEHAAWTPETLAAAPFAMLLEEGYGVYTTAHGYRVIAILESPVSYTEVEGYIHAMLLDLLRLRISPDSSCRDWSRHFRLPHVMRDGRPFESKLMLG